nr:dihydrodipicolinate reductase C-terminal domain-containing protein [Sulfobacillus harzensis]
MAEALGEQRAPHIDVSLEETLGTRATRGAQIAGVPVHSIRLPSYMLGFDVIFGMGDERLILRHESGSSPEPYVSGTLMAVKHVTSITGLVRGLDQLLFGKD